MSSLGDSNLLTLIIAVLVGGLLAGGMNAVLNWYIRRDELQYQHKLDTIAKQRELLLKHKLELQRTSETIGGVENVGTKKMAEIINEKKEKFKGISSVIFHFVNENQVRDFYNDYFKEPTIENLVSETFDEMSGEIKGSLPQILESKISNKDIKKWISTIKLPDLTINSMFLRYQRETISNNQVALGIEEVDIELSELQAFEKTIELLDTRFELKLDKSLLDTQKIRLKERAARRTISKLEQANGWILVEGKFKITKDNNLYKCEYMHPVNEYLPPNIGPVTITVVIASDTLESHVIGNYAQSIGKMIPLRIYGHVWQPLDSKLGVWDLQITPLVIY